MMNRRQFLMATAAATVSGYAGALHAGAASADLSSDALRKFLRSITAEKLRARLYFIASDLLEGRDTGSRGQHLTALYIASGYVQLGLNPATESSAPVVPESFFQRFTNEYKRPKTSSLSLSIAGQQMQLKLPGDQGATQAFFSGLDFQDVEAPVIFAGFGIEDPQAGYQEYTALKQQGVSLDGKWVMVLDGEPKFLAADGKPSKWGRGLFEKRFALTNAGKPRGLLIASASVAGSPEFEALTRQAPHGLFQASMRAGSAGVYPATFTISRDVADAMLRVSNTTVEAIGNEIESSKAPKPGSLANVSAIARFEPYPPAETENVVAILPGSDQELSKEYIVVSAHHDHLGRDPERQGDQIYNGAADDGSGTVGLMEIAAAFAKAKAAGAGPRRSIIFLHTSGEEKGLRGSAYFTENPPVPLDSMVADINMDGIAGVDPNHPRQSKNYLYVLNQPPELRGVVDRALQRSGISIELDTHADFNSDDRRFRQYKIPYIYYSTGLVKNYHQPSDEPQTIDYGHLERASQLAFATVWLLANQAAAVKHPRLSSLKLQGYGCAPCGLACDNLSFEDPGTCPCCGMELVKNFV